MSEIASTAFDLSKFMTDLNMDNRAKVALINTSGLMTALQDDTFRQEFANAFRQGLLTPSEETTEEVRSYNGQQVVQKRYFFEPLLPPQDSNGTEGTIEERLNQLLEKNGRDASGTNVVHKGTGRPLQQSRSMQTDQYQSVAETPEEEMLAEAQEMLQPDIDWQKIFGNREMLRKVQAYLNENQDLVEKRGCFVESRRLGDGKYFYYQVPYDVLVQYAEIKEEFDTKHFSEQYAMEMPVVALAVRSEASEKQLKKDHGQVAVTAGWTADSFFALNVVTDSKGNKVATSHPDRRNMLEDLLGGKDAVRGHSSVLVIPSAWFEGAYNLKDPNIGAALSYEQLRGMCPEIAAMTGKEEEFFTELFNSGRAAKYYEDMYKTFRFKNIIGHSRGGEVVQLLSCKYPELNCLALMPASGRDVSGERLIDLIKNKDEVVKMELVFRGLDKTIGVGAFFHNLTRIDLPYYLSPTITKTVIRDDVIPEWLVKEFGASHQGVIQNADVRATRFVIGLLAFGARETWQEQEFSPVPPVTIRGSKDRLSVRTSIEKYFSDRYQIYRQQMSQYILPGMEEEVISEVKDTMDLLLEVGHYGFEHPPVRDNILDRWWDVLDKISVRDQDIVVARKLKTRLESSDQKNIPFTVTTSESKLDINKGEDPLAQLMAQEITSGKTKPLVLDVWEYMRLVRASLLLGYEPPITQQILERQQLEISRNKKAMSRIKASGEELNTALHYIEWSETNEGKKMKIRLKNLQKFLSIHKEDVDLAENKPVAKSLLTLLSLYLNLDNIVFTSKANIKTATDKTPSLQPAHIDRGRNEIETAFNILLTGDKGNGLNKMSLAERLDRFYEMLSRPLSQLFVTLSGKELPVVKNGSATVTRKTWESLAPKMVTSDILNYIAKKPLSQTPSANELLSAIIDADEESMRRLLYHRFKREFEAIGGNQEKIINGKKFVTEFADRNQQVRDAFEAGLVSETARLINASNVRVTPIASASRFIHELIARNSEITDMDDVLVESYIKQVYRSYLRLS